MCYVEKLFASSNYDFSLGQHAYVTLYCVHGRCALRIVNEGRGSKIDLLDAKHMYCKLK